MNETSGLDSIALAVAHLEEERERRERCDNEGEEKPQTQPSSSPMLASSSSSASLPPLPCRTVAPLRVVSSDKISVGSATTKTCSKNAKIIANAKSKYAYILADPIAWLRKTEYRPPLIAPDHPIMKVEAQDVLCGRGGETNHHNGNIQYRLLVKAFQPLYVSAKRRDKPLIAKCIVYSVRQVGGRFLKKINNQVWVDVGNIKAREKTSQALREGAPELRGDDRKHELHINSTGMTNFTIPFQAPPPPPQMMTNSTFLSALLAPLQQSMGRPLVLTPQQHFLSQTPVTQSMNMASSPQPISKGKRSAIISDVDSCSSSEIVSIDNRGPRLKRFKKRLAQEP